MEGRRSKGISFIELMNQQLKDHELEKMLKSEHKGPRLVSRREKDAMEVLIELDDEMDVTQNTEEDVQVGRWSNYKVPQRLEERLSIQKKVRRVAMGATPSYRYMESHDRAALPSVYRSEKTIPKLKVMLNQLDCPLGLQTSRNTDRQRAISCSNKMKTHISPQALAISNKQEIKPGSKSERKTISSMNGPDFSQNGENKRPPSGSSIHWKGQPASSSYQKIKRTFGNAAEHELVYEKQILSQIIKGNIKAGGSDASSPLSNMLNHFKIAADNPKKKGSTAKLGLDRLLS